MKVIFLIENFYPSIGGPYSAVKDTVKELKKKNIRATVVTKKKNLIEEIKKADICHLYGGWTFFYLKVFFISYFFKKKIIIHPFGIYEPWAFSQKKFKKIIAWNLYQKHILKKADIIHCVSNMEKKNLLKLNSSFKTVVLPYGISKNILKKKVKKKFNKKALFLSRLHPKKGLTDLIKAWISIDNKFWKLDIVGPYVDQNYYDSLQSLIHNSGNKNITILKPIFNNYKKYKLFENYDFFVLPTKSDPFAIVILECLSQGLPVLTNVNTPWNYIRTYNAGWFIKDNYLELKENLKKIFNTPKSQFYIKSKNAIRLAKQFSWEYILKKYILMYYSLYKQKNL
jgi:glycosyltransferase involved in cell wall biosynthesis